MSFAILALAGCSAAASSAPDDAQAGIADTMVQTVSQEEETAIEDATDVVDDPCSATPDNRVDFPHGAEGAVFAELRHDLIDLGESSYAQGEVTLNDEGQIASYTVAPGDGPIAIGDRFCVDYVTVLQYNRTWPEIDPGEVLELRPDPSVQWGDSTRPE